MGKQKEFPVACQRSYGSQKETQPQGIRQTVIRAAMCEGMARALFYEQKKADSKVGL